MSAEIANTRPAPATAAPLARSMRVTGVLLLTLSVITPATSVFVIVPGVIAEAGTGAVDSLALGALLALAMSLVYAELSSAFPNAGGEYAILARTLGPFVGFVFLGLNFAGLSLAPSLMALGAVDYLSAFAPGLPRIPFAIALLVGSTLFSILNIRLNAWVTGLFLAVELVVLAALAALGLAHVHRPMSELLMHPVFAQGSALEPASPVRIGLAAAVAAFAYNGFGQAVYFSEEMHEAPRLLARTIVLALVITVACEFIPVAAMLLGVRDVAGTLTAQSPLAAFMREAGGAWVSGLLELGIVLAIVNALIASILLNARLLFATARDGAWHGAVNEAMKRLHARFGSPWVATLVAGLFMIVGCFLPSELLLVVTGTTVVVTYLLICVAAIVGRSTGSTRHGHYRMPWYPLAPGLALAGLLAIVWANWLDPTVGRPSLIIDIVVLGVTALYFLHLRRTRGVAIVLTDPEAEPTPAAAIAGTDRA